MFYIFVATDNIARRENAKSNARYYIAVIKDYYQIFHQDYKSLIALYFVDYSAVFCFEYRVRFSYYKVLF